jgi:hypothetical protein
MLSRFPKATVRLAVAIAALFALWWLYTAWTANPKAEARLSRDQAAATAQSGADAVNTVGAAGEREAASDAVTRENERTIRNAEGADSPVHAEARAAGLDALCRRDAYRNDPRCVRQ